MPSLSNVYTLGVCALNTAASSPGRHLTFLNLFALNKNTTTMVLANDFKLLLETIKNDVSYQICKREELSMDISDDSVITFTISTIEAVVRAKPRLEHPVILSHIATHEGYACVQFVAPYGTLETSKFLYLAEGDGYITGTAIVDPSHYTFPEVKLATYGDFLEQMKGTGHHPLNRQYTH
jgi:hypothetical protein